MKLHRIRHAVDAGTPALRTDADFHELAEMENMPHVPQFLHHGDHTAFVAAGRAVQEGVTLLFGQFFPGSIQGAVHLVGDGPQVPPAKIRKNNRARVLLLASKTALLDRKVRVGHYQIQVKLATFPHALAGGATALGVIKAEEPGFQFRNRNSALGASQLRTLQAIFLLRISRSILALARRQQKTHQFSVGQLQRPFQSLPQAAHVLAFQSHAVDDRLNGVLLVTHQGGHILDPVDHTIHTGAHKTVFLEFGQFLAVFALAFLHNGGHHRNLLALVAYIQIIYNLVHGLSLDDPAALGAVGHAQSGKKQAVMVQNFHHRTHGTAGVTVHRFLVDGNRRRNAANALHLRVFHATDELTGISRQGFYEAALALLKHRIKSEAGLARTRNAGHHHDRIAGNFQIHMLQVVFVGVADIDKLGHNGYSTFAPNIVNIWTNSKEGSMTLVLWKACGFGIQPQMAN